MKLFWPIWELNYNYISQGFGEHGLDYSQFGLIGHNGIDFVADRGVPIHAVVDGWIVEQTNKETGFGLRVSQRVESDGKFYLITYGHMLRLEVDISLPYNWGDKTRPVIAGQIIGYVDSTGFSTGDHVHLGLYEQLENGTRLNQTNGYGGAIDPNPFLAQKGERPMQFKTQNYKGELRIVLEADNETTWEALCKVYGVDPKIINEEIK